MASPCQSRFEPCARLRLLAPVLLCLLAAQAQSQDEGFLDCADITERDARVSCLEQALQRALVERDSARPAANTPAQPAPVPVVTAPAPAPPSAPSPSAAPTAAISTPVAPSSPDPAPAPATNESMLGRLDVFGWFDGEGRDAGQEVAESLDARVSELDYYKPDVLTITLNNGQVWRQKYARRFNLREGDAVTIYRESGKLQYRLEAERFNGFIRVERLR